DGYAPEQVQDFYPTPGTASTVMYYTGINPLNGKKVYVCTDYHEKQLQRALLQFNRPQNREMVIEALKKLGREDLIGFGPECLVRPVGGKYVGKDSDKKVTSRGGRNDSRRGEKKQNRSTKNTVSAKGGKQSPAKKIKSNPKKKK
ncbi:MAG: DUF3362 domain-containing protein, partial [Oscillospiraceae bacterium]|nr:DUF3362 domain-containing protein [Oscillospiraceae bacterium]